MRIALYQGKSLISRLIRWQTRSQYSHAAFLCDDGSVIEAWQPCVRLVVPNNPGSLAADISGLSKQHTPGTVVDIFDFVVPLTEIEKEKLYFLARRDVGTPYDYRSIFRFLTRDKSKVRKRHLFCSEQVFARCAQVNRALLDRTEAWRVPPDWISRSPLLYKVKTVTTVQA